MNPKFIAHIYIKYLYKLVSYYIDIVNSFIINTHDQNRTVKII